MAAASDYDRSTRACTLATLSPALAAALRAHAEQYQLGSLDAPSVACWETTSTKKKKGLFARQPEVVLTGIVLAPPLLLWAAGKPGEKPAVLSGRLRDLRVQDYEKTAMHKLVADSGLEVSGRLTDSPEAASAFIGLGPEPAAQQCRAAVAGAIARAG
jgi:hypothetical protein